MIEFEDLIGTPFVYGGRDKSGLDCYGLVMEMLSRCGVQPEDYGWSNESHAIQAMMLAAKNAHWQACAPQTKAVALFRIGSFVRHVGFFISGSKFIHCWEKSGGVVVESFNSDWSKRLVGCYQYAAK